MLVRQRAGDHMRLQLCDDDPMRDRVWRRSREGLNQVESLWLQWPTGHRDRWLERTRAVVLGEVERALAALLLDDRPALGRAEVGGHRRAQGARRVRVG